METTKLLKEAMFYEQLDGNSVQCHLCAHNCKIAEGKVGVCSVRRNIGGKLYSLIYGKASSISADPVEKKPLYHFYPGSSVLSFGSVGCNLKCQYCQNWQISQVKPEDYTMRTMGTVEKILAQIRRYTCSGVAFTYNEPTIWFEFAYEVAQAIKKKGYYTIFVSNGYINPEPLRKIAPYLDAVNIDLKAIDAEQYMRMSSAKLQPVLDTLILARELGIHVEITTLVVPGFNDSPDDLEKICRWIHDNLGSDVAFHLTRYHPDYHYDAPATPMKKLIEAYEIAKKVGLDYAYLGNIMKTDYENTRCKKCSTLLVKRKTKFVERLYSMKNDGIFCPKCDTEIPIVDRRRKIIECLSPTNDNGCWDYCGPIEIGDRRAGCRGFSDIDLRMPTFFYSARTPLERMIIIKLGGSVITKKREYATLNSSIVREVSKELSEYAKKEPMIIIHGAGSYGHILAKKHSLKDPTPSEELPLAIAKVQRDVRHLNLMVVEEMVEHGIPAVSVPPALCTGLHDGDLSRFDREIFQKYLDMGTVPVTFGDVVPDAKRGVSILSGDTLMERLAKEFGAERAVFVLDVDGFYNRPPDEPEATIYSELTADELEEILRSGPVSSKNINEVVDITGSILGKMESALRIARGGTDTYLVNGRIRERLSDILNARPTVSTKINGEGR